MKTASMLFAALSMTMTTRPVSALDAAAQSRISALFRAVDHPNTPGAAVMVIHNGEPIFTKGYGVANLDTNTPCAPNTNFRLASVTKQFTAMAVLILADRGRLKLDETLADFFPEFPAYGRQITVHHLLTHTSGLLDYEDLVSASTTLPVLDQDVLRLVMGATNDAPQGGVQHVAWTEDSAENEARLKRTLKSPSAPPSPTKRDKTYFPPGTKFRYSNTGFSLLALIVEARSGQRFAHFLKENIFAPIQMTNTLAYEQGFSTVPNRAFGHSQTANAWTRTDQSLTSSVLGDGGIYSSLADLAKWDLSLYNDKLVSEPLLRAAFTPHVVTDQPGRSYGYGWFISKYRGVKELTHSGDTIGFRTRITRLPEKHFTVILLANRTDVNLDELPHRIADIVLFGSK